MITSSSNPQIKFLRSLYLPKYRNESGMFLIEGLKLVGQAFDSKADINQLIISPELLISDYGQSLVGRTKKASIDILELSASVFTSIARKEKPQGIAALVKQNWHDSSHFVIHKKDTKTIWLGIESIQNPGNLGTILRSCDATGVSGLFLLPNSTDPYDPAAVKASMGAIFTVPFCKLDYAQFHSFIKGLNGFTILGTSDKASQNAFSFSYPNNLFLLMGSEREGLSKELIDVCDEMLRIPMVGECDSLNLSVATGIILYEIFNQHSGLIRKYD